MKTNKLNIGVIYPKVPKRVFTFYKKMAERKEYSDADWNELFRLVSDVKFPYSNKEIAIRDMLMCKDIPTSIADDLVYLSSSCNETYMTALNCRSLSESALNYAFSSCDRGDVAVDFRTAQIIKDHDLDTNPPFTDVFTNFLVKKYSNNNELNGVQYEFCSNFDVVRKQLNEGTLNELAISHLMNNKNIPDDILKLIENEDMDLNVVDRYRGNIRFAVVPMIKESLNMAYRYLDEGNQDESDKILDEMKHIIKAAIKSKCFIESDDVENELETLYFDICDILRKTKVNTITSNVAVDIRNMILETATSEKFLKARVDVFNSSDPRMNCIPLIRNKNFSFQNKIQKFYDLYNYISDLLNKKAIFENIKDKFELLTLIGKNLTNEVIDNVDLFNQEPTKNFLSNKYVMSWQSLSQNYCELFSRICNKFSESKNIGSYPEIKFYTMAKNFIVDNILSNRFGNDAVRKSGFNSLIDCKNILGNSFPVSMTQIKKCKKETEILLNKYDEKGNDKDNLEDKLVAEKFTENEADNIIIGLKNVIIKPLFSPTHIEETECLAFFVPHSKEDFKKFTEALKTFEDSNKNIGFSDILSSYTDMFNAVSFYERCKDKHILSRWIVQSTSSLNFPVCYIYPTDKFHNIIFFLSDKFLKNVHLIKNEDIKDIKNFEEKFMYFIKKQNESAKYSGLNATTINFEYYKGIRNCIDFLNELNTIISEKENEKNAEREESIKEKEVKSVLEKSENKKESVLEITDEVFEDKIPESVKENNLKIQMLDDFLEER